MKNVFKSAAVFLAMILLFSCSDTEAVKEEFSQKSDIIAKTYIEDRSLDVFDARLEYDEEGWELEGAATREDVRVAVENLADSLLGPQMYTNSFVMLPQVELGDSIYAVTMVSVTPLRRTPRHSAEMVDQTVMGRELKLLQKRGGWYRAQTHYNYVGWVNSSAIWRTDSSGLAQWRKAPKVRVTALNGFVYSDALEESYPVTDIVLNMNMKLVDRGRAWTMVETPDGRRGYIPSGQVEPYQSKEPKTRQALLETARSMMGVPYLWGGNSSKGNDCSGFTQTVFINHGVEIPRDASQQARVGETIIPDSTFGNVLPGDLFFFGYNGRITHVGIGLGGADFIDQGGRVAYNSLDEESPLFNEYRKRTFVTIKRVLN